MRVALLADYGKVALHVTRKDSPQPDMWRDWSAEVRRIAPEYGVIPPPPDLPLGEAGSHEARRHEEERERREGGARL